MYFHDEVPINFCLNSEKRKFKSPFLEVLDLEKFKRETLEYNDYINAPNLYGNTVLHTALTNPQCDAREIAAFLKHGAKLEYKNKVGDTPLSFAVYYNVNVEVVKLLLDEGANVNATNNFLDTPLHRALDKHTMDIEVVKLLIDYKADLNKLNFRGDAPFHYCLNNNPDVNVVRLLLNSGANRELVDKNGNTLLHIALDRKYNLEVIKLLMDTGIPINSKNNEGDTPLQFALRNLVCRPDIIKLLLDNRADCNLPNKNSYYPLQTALKNVASTLKVFYMLLFYGARVNVSDIQGNSVLHTACISFANCNVQTIRLLLMRGAQINAVNSTGETPIMFAVKCLSCKLDVIRLLIERGASLHIADVSGNSPLHFAVSRTNCTVGVVKLMLDFGADVNQQNDIGRTPLFVALGSRKLNMCVIRFLLNNGADINSTDMFLNTPLHYAVDNPICTIELVSLLLKKNASLNAVNSFLETAMHHAMQVAEVKVVKFMLEKRGLISARDKEGNFPLENAILYLNSARDADSKEFVKMLIKYTLLEKSSFDVENLLLKSFDFSDLFDFTRLCREEVGRMHSEFIICGLKLWGLIGDRTLPLDEKWIAMDWDIKNLLDILAANKYPIYSDVIASTIRRDAMISKLKDIMVYTVSNDFKAKTVLNFHSVCCLSEQMSKKTLLSLLLAFHKGRKYSRKRRCMDPHDCDVCFKRPKLKTLRKGLASVYVPI